MTRVRLRGLFGVSAWVLALTMLFARATSAQATTSDGAAGAAQPPAPEPPAQAPAETHDMAGPAGLAALQLRGFTDIDWVGARDANQPNTFSLGQLDLFLSSRIAADFNMVGEVVFEAGEDNAIAVDVERLLLQYSPSDTLTIAAGRYHTAIGFYNAAYHHGNWFQTAIGRPFIFRFEDEGGILPVHGVGVTAQGQIPSGTLGLRWLAEISNGRRWRSTGEAVQNVEDENDRKAINVGLIARPATVPGLQAGISAYRDRLVVGGPSVDETIVAAHAVYQASRFELLNEGIFIRHARDGAGALTSKTFYSQVSQQFDRLRPYVRYEYLDIPLADPVFTDLLGTSRGPSVGLRFDAAAPVALKLQYSHFTGPVRPRTNGVTVQLAFTF